MQYMVLFSHLTVRLPSELLSQKHDAAVCNPAPVCTYWYAFLCIHTWPHKWQTCTRCDSPFFCMIMVVTTYLKGLFRSANRLIQVSRQVDVHWPTCTGRHCEGCKHIQTLSRYCFEFCSTLKWLYCWFCNTASIDSLIMLVTSSATKAACTSNKWAYKHTYATVSIHGSNLFRTGKLCYLFAVRHRHAATVRSQ